MNNENYHFKIGAFGCIALSDGVMTYAPPTFPPPAVFLFCNAPGDRIEKVLRGHNINIHQWIQWTSSYTCLLVNTGKCRVLVDTGAGRLSSSTGKLLDNLKNEGITPDDIDLVILSHAHPDHIGGNISTQGKPVFTNARWVIWEDEWQFWTTEQAESRLDEHSKEILINIARTFYHFRARSSWCTKKLSLFLAFVSSNHPGIPRDFWQYLWFPERTGCYISPMLSFIRFISPSLSGSQLLMSFLTRLLLPGINC